MQHNSLLNLKGNPWLHVAKPLRRLTDVSRGPSFSQRSRILSNRQPYALELTLQRSKSAEALPAADRISYSGTVKAGASPRKTLATVDDSTDAIMTIEIVSVGAASPEAGRSTVSTAKKHPAMAALKPARGDGDEERG
jgi:hypothetical protein